jgi:sRNA-binding protein
MNAFGQLGGGYFQAMGAMQAARAQLAQIQAEMRAADRRHQEAMRRGDAQEAAEARMHLERMEEARRQTTILGARAQAELAEAQQNARPSPQQMAFEGVVFGAVGQKMRAAAQGARDGTGWRQPLAKDNARGILYRTFPGYTADIYERILAEVYDGQVAVN